LRKAATEQQLEADGTYSTVTTTWTYDALQRLTQENSTSTISGNTFNDQYVYDLVGNRLSKTDTSGSQTLVSNYQYNANDQLTTETGTLNGASNYSTIHGYDANGALTSVSRTGSGAEVDSYGYDLQNRLTSATISRTENGQSVAITVNAYAYNDDGIRAVTDVTVNGTRTITGYFNDPDNFTGYSQVLEEHANGSTTPTMSYFVGLSVLGQTSGTGVASHLLADGLGSTRLLTDANGAITARYSYDAFGSILGTILGVLNRPATNILFTGEQFDSTLKEYYLRARYYDPAAGRFDSFDSFPGLMVQPGSLTTYLYASDDPANRVDPGGHFDGAIGLMAASAIGNFLEALWTEVDIRSWTAAQRVYWGFEQGLDASQIYLDSVYADLFPGDDLGLLDLTEAAWEFIETEGIYVRDDEGDQADSGPADVSNSTSSDSLTLSARVPRLSGGVIPLKYRNLVTSYGKLTYVNQKNGLSNARANHLNQNAIYGGTIPREKGIAQNLTVEQHSAYHASLRKEFAQYRAKGIRPTNRQYEQASQRALIKAGVSKQKAGQFTKLARNQRIKYGFKQDDLVPRLPGS
jgi:RHS repeat-associated protein